MFKTELNNLPDKNFPPVLYFFISVNYSIIRPLNYQSSLSSPSLPSPRVVSNPFYLLSISHGHSVLSLTVASLIHILIFSCLASLLPVLTYSSPPPVLWEELPFYKVHMIISLPIQRLNSFPVLTLKPQLFNFMFLSCPYTLSYIFLHLTLPFLLQL